VVPKPEVLRHFIALFRVSARQSRGVELNATFGVGLAFAGIVAMRANMLAGLALVVVGAFLATSSEARHRRPWQWTEPTAAASPADATGANEQDHRPNLAARFRRSSGIAAVIDRTIRSCEQQGTELANWPFATIANVVAPDQYQAAALEELRIAARQAADTLITTCPRSVSADPSAQFEAVEQAADVASGALAGVQPALQRFYGTLDDEQKARLLRDMAAPARQDQVSRREIRHKYSDSRRSRRYAETDRTRASPTWNMLCEHMTTALRGWPISDVERNVRLSDGQRISFYELVAASLKVADTLASSCPADDALTPARRLEVLGQRLAALRQAAIGLRPAVQRFFGALDQQQKVRFAGLN
jgi:hypothetical protein